MRRLFAWGSSAVLASLLVACAVGVPPGSHGDDDDVQIDARTDGRPPADAPPGIDAGIDAPPAVQTITLNQTGSQTVEAGSSIACAENDGAGGIVATRDNSYWRVFRLSDFGVNRPFTPNRVTFGVEQAAGLVGSQSVQVRLYRLNGALNTANMTNLSVNSATVPDVDLGIINVPIAPAPTLQPNETLVVEVFSPDGDPQELGFGDVFFIGTNRQTETAPGYLSSVGCGFPQPTTYGSLGDPSFANIRLLLTVTGTY